MQWVTFNHVVLTFKLLTRLLHDVYHRFSSTWMGAAISLCALDSRPMCPDILESLSVSTLIDSTPGVLVAWDSFGREYGFDGAAAAHDGHGRRLSESLVEKCNLETAEQIAVRPRLSTTLILLESYSYACLPIAVLWHISQK
jgi:hypothetical protein